MEVNEKLKCAGDLKEELEEMEKIFLNNDSVMSPVSGITDLCGALLTLFCC